LLAEQKADAACTAKLLSRISSLEEELAHARKEASVKREDRAHAFASIQQQDEENIENVSGAEGTLRSMHAVHATLKSRLDTMEQAQIARGQDETGAEEIFAVASPAQIVDNPKNVMFMKRDSPKSASKIKRIVGQTTAVVRLNDSSARRASLSKDLGNLFCRFDKVFPSASLASGSDESFTSFEIDNSVSCETNAEGTLVNMSRGEIDELKELDAIEEAVVSQNPCLREQEHQTVSNLLVRVQELELLLKQKEGIISNLTFDLQESESKLEVAIASSATAEMSSEELFTLAEVLQTRTDELMAALETAKAERDALAKSSGCDGSEENLLAFKREIEERQQRAAELADLQHTVDALEHQLALFRVDRSAEKKRLHTLQARLTAMESSKVFTPTDQCGLQTDFTLEVMKELVTEKNLLTTSIETQGQEIKILREQVASLQEQVSAPQCVLPNSSEMAQLMEKLHEHLESDSTRSKYVQSLENKIAEAEGKYRETIFQKDSIEISSANEINRLKHQVETEKRHVETLQQELRTERKHNASQADLTKRLQNLLDDKDASLATLKDLISDGPFMPSAGSRRGSAATMPATHPPSSNARRASMSNSLPSKEMSRSYERRLSASRSIPSPTVNAVLLNTAMLDSSSPDCSASSN